MPSDRVSTHDAVRLFQAAQQPVFLVDEDRRIVFVNAACAQWIGVSAAELRGRECRYQSAAVDPLEAAADALCPPPEALQGKRTVGVITKPGADPTADARHAEFVPLAGKGDRPNCVLGVVDVQPLKDGQDAGSNESKQLHELVRRLRRETALAHRLDRLAGKSPAMARIRAQIKVAAATNASVCIVGSPGIGRQHVARTIHCASNIARGAFVPVSCSALTPELLRSTINSVVERHDGAENPSSATVLLTDVETLPSEGQSELAAMIASNSKSIRLISTSSAPLDELAASGTFRAELSNLLSTLAIELPPLAARREDIPPVAQSLLEDLNGKHEKQLQGFTSEAMDRLVEHDWPGQVNELAGVVREAFEVAEGAEVTVADLPKQMRLAADAARFARPPAQAIDLEAFLAEIETQLIERALRQSKQNKSKAARLLGLNRPKLYRRMVQLGLESGEESDPADVEGDL